MLLKEVQYTLTKRNSIGVFWNSKYALQNASVNAHEEVSWRLKLVSHIDLKNISRVSLQESAFHNSSEKVADLYPQVLKMLNQVGFLFDKVIFNVFSV